MLHAGIFTLSTHRLLFNGGSMRLIALQYMIESRNYIQPRSYLLAAVFC